jgi:Holliday junction DNA helicase RuvA
VIASLSGRVAALGPDGAVIEVGGLGIAVSCAPATIARLRMGEPARLATSLVVREDSLTLYGFADDDERALFELLQTANGVGPRLAQTILGVLAPREARRAIATADYAALVKVPGIGRKVAERIVLELRDRIGSLGADSVPAELAGLTAVAPWRQQVAGALAGLGFGARESEEALDALSAGLAASPDAAPDVAVLLRRAIQLLGRRQ